MDAFFPLNKNVKKKNISSLIIAILLYVVLSIVVGLLQKLLGAIPVVNWVMGIVGYLVWYMCSRRYSGYCKIS
jgi:predicted membrane protein